MPFPPPKIKPNPLPPLTKPHEGAPIPGVSCLPVVSAFNQPPLSSLATAHLRAPTFFVRTARPPVYPFYSPRVRVPTRHPSKAAKTTKLITMPASSGEVRTEAEPFARDRRVFTLAATGWLHYSRFRSDVPGRKPRCPRQTTDLLTQINPFQGNLDNFRSERLLARCARAHLSAVFRNRPVQSLLGKTAERLFFGPD